jgi:hypothetical protein
VPIIGEAGGGIERRYRNSLYFLLNFPVNRPALQNKVYLDNQKANEHPSKLK